ncbi:tandem C2 domains nuclear protein-like isoform X1 [Acipenser ruthenus]|uniref:tandem C2 domains nuclear protein-like isoform X1 n=1 Tax=Acipenser ruthenus TaxID=7906 RepID=UPI0027409481|nr:tandem C2 domains nuclear protein-like isoform X1 [Acipenser ruthenus]
MDYVACILLAIGLLLVAGTAVTIVFIVFKNKNKCFFKCTYLLKLWHKIKNVTERAGGRDKHCEPQSEKAVEPKAQQKRAHLDERPAAFPQPNLKHLPMQPIERISALPCDEKGPLASLAKEQYHQKKKEIVGGAVTAKKPKKTNYLNSKQGTGKLNIQLFYNTDKQQLCVTVVQAKYLYIKMKHLDTADTYIKGTVLLKKPFKFKTSVKKKSNDPMFQEEFICSTSQSSLINTNLLLQVMSLTPHRQTLGHCAVLLNTVGPQQQDLWLDLQQWQGTQASQGALCVGLCYNSGMHTMELKILEAKNIISANVFVKVQLFQQDVRLRKKKSRCVKSTIGFARWEDRLLFQLPSTDSLLPGVHFQLQLYSKDFVRDVCPSGELTLGWKSENVALEHWKNTVLNPGNTITMWHTLS